MKRPISRIKNLIHAAVLLIATALAPSARATGHIDPDTLQEVSHGTFGAISYVRYEAMFEGETSNHRPYRVPCQIIAPETPGQGSGLLLFDWLVPSTIPTAVGQEQADARYTMTDEFLFGRRLSYATVRCDPVCLGKRSLVPNPTRPWSDGLLTIDSEFITSPGDEFEIVSDYVKALRSDQVALNILGTVTRTAAFAYSASAHRLRGLLRSKEGKGLFDFSLVGGSGDGYDTAVGNKIGHSASEKAPPADAGLEIDFQSESDVLALGAHKTRHEESNYRVYQFAGAAHIRDVDIIEFGLPEPETANSADWVPFFRALFVAADKWSEDGTPPPPSIWLGAPNDPQITRDEKGNALVRFVGGLPVNTDAYRLPEVAVGENQYIALDPDYNDGTLPGIIRMLAGRHVDLTGTFTDHHDYVDQVTFYTAQLETNGYLLPEDAAAIIAKAMASDIGNP